MRWRHSAARQNQAEEPRFFRKMAGRVVWNAERFKLKLLS